MDFIVQLPTTKDGHDAILVFVDRLTKMTHLAATTTTATAEATAKLFRQHVIKLHGWPYDIVSDRDSKFAGKLTRELNELNGIESRLSTAFHPQTDGQTERVNRVLEDMLRQMSTPLTLTGMSCCPWLSLPSIMLGMRVSKTLPSCSTMACTRACQVNCLSRSTHVCQLP